MAWKRSRVRVPVAPPRKNGHIAWPFFYLHETLFASSARAQNDRMRMAVEVSFIYLHAHLVAIEPVMHDMLPALVFLATFVSNSS